MEAINRQMEGMDIEDEENEKLVFDEGVEDNINKFELCLVGRFLTEKNVNSKAMKSKLADVWRPAKGINIKDLKSGLFLFQFYHIDDMQWILNGGPWSFDGAMLITNTIGTGEDPLEVSLYNIPFWIQLYGLPGSLMTEQVGKQLGDFFGTFVMYDPNNNSSIWRECMRLKILVDVRKPLKRKKKICRKNGSECIMDRSSSEIVKEWGNWLRAPPRKAAGQERSRWLTDERDVEWGVNSGNANYNQHFSESVSADRMRGGNQGRDFRGKAHIGAEKSQQIEFSNVLAANIKTDSLIGPDIGELNGLNVEERKRRRGLDNTEYMETEETISFANKIEELRVKYGFSQCFSVDRVGRSGGLAIFWKHNVACEVVGYSQNHVDVNFIENNAAIWRLSCFYGFPERERRKHSWDLIRRLAGVSQIPWCIIGDFNDLLYSSDKWGNLPHPQSLMDGFRAAIDDCFLSELDLSGGKYTWEKSHGKSDWVRERLDRAFATQQWWNLFPLCKLLVYHVSVSDHDPIFLDLLSTSFSKKQFRFKFENTWLQEPNFRKKVSDFWLELPTVNIIPKLVSVSSFMARWGRNFFHKFRDKIRRQKEVIRLLVDRVDEDGISNYFMEKEKLNDLLCHEEVYWKQRAKNFWLTEGDANTKFFHASASARKKANYLPFLETDSGEEVSNHEDMCQVVKDYYTVVFTSGHNAEILQLDESERRITEEQNHMLVAEMTFEEFSVAIKQMHPDKTSGPDGLNPAFFQQFWSILGREVYESCKCWLDSVSFPANLNETNVVLIPKKENARCMKDLRPIALCNVLYKVLAKVLSNRLKVLLPNVISENQSAFVPGRSIADNVLVAFEVVHHMRRKSRGRDGEIALKLDISKAYDRVNWSYLKARMQAMGFCRKWIQWIMLCVTTVSYDFCFNGTSVGPVCPSRGLQQGDPLSPYLFLLCVEGLSNSLDKAAMEGNIHGSQVSNTAPIITHLLFADDSFLFFCANLAETTVVKSLLNDYEALSGQSVNFQKSAILFSSNVPQSERGTLAGILGVSNELQDGKYLGLPSFVGRSKKRVFGFVKDKVCKRLQGWKSKAISQACKSILIRNVAQSIPSYCMSCFLLPKSLCQELERMLNKYWWCTSSSDRRGISWLSWDSMSSSKSRGGMGFRNLYSFNIALLGKHCWNFIKKPHSLVARVYKARYYPDSHFLHASVSPGSSYIWSGIMTARRNICKGYRWILGDGRDINAIRDPWLQNKDDFCVSQSIDYGCNQVQVSSFFRTDDRSWEADKVMSFFTEDDARLILAVRIPQNPTVDRLAWSRTTNGQYTVKTGYQLWHDSNIGPGSVYQSNGWSKLWRLNLPHKIKIFLWRFCRNNIPVRRRLSAKGVRLPITCPMCMADIEHLGHVFFDCLFASSCWHYAGLTYDMQTVDFVPDWLIQKISSASREEIEVVAKVLWGMWFFRNRRVWDNKVVTGRVAIDWSSKSISDWKKAKHLKAQNQVLSVRASNKSLQKWKPPREGCLKLNVDASIKLGSDLFTVGLVLRDHHGIFVGGKAICL
ncbi:uncharacterized protein LOC141719854 [Apium graveolens]|uniref:uncharacterized protein LOC141719854 n=1 Tax=Apium graveolens TaxID=4045 RepID=UPI003D7A526C